MGKVHFLPEHVISKIAAGEVIQRPASVVKELVENSLDAGADRIEVRVEEGGLLSIIVMDNGQGMDREDLFLSVQRHATSKIRDVDDLLNGVTFGFRGEALSSIAAVSRLKISSRPGGAEVGYLLKLEGGAEPTIEPIQCLEGTKVEVRDLFYNTPVRKKFLKAPPTEFRYLLDWMIRFAFAHPQKEFLLKRDQEQILCLEKAGDPIPRIALIWGKDAAEGVKIIKREQPGVSLSLYLGNLEHTRPKPDRCLFFVNRRPIRDKTILKAVVDGCLYALPKGLYPQCLVFIEIMPREVDVNVHPSKEELRFSDLGKIYSAIYKALDGDLRRPVYGVGGEGTIAGTHEHIPYYEVRSFKRLPMWGEDEIKKGKQFRIIGQLRNSYILCESLDGLYIFDQHAAHERIMYEKFLEFYGKKDFRSQQLIMPYVIELPMGEYDKIMENIDLIEELGIKISPFGGNSIALEQVPWILKDKDFGGIIQVIVDNLMEKDKKKEELLHSIVSGLACHAAVKAGDRLDDGEMQHIVESILSGEIMKSCPHGRPIFRLITYGELEKEFKRT